MSEDRHRKAQDRDLIEDPLQKALKEAENGIKQYEKIFELFNEAVDLGEDGVDDLLHGLAADDFRDPGWYAAPEGTVARMISEDPDFGEPVRRPRS